MPACSAWVLDYLHTHGSRIYVWETVGARTGLYSLTQLPEAIAHGWRLVFVMAYTTQGLLPQPISQALEGSGQPRVPSPMAPPVGPAPQPRRWVEPDPIGHPDRHRDPLARKPKPRLPKSRKPRKPRKPKYPRGRGKAA